MIKAIKKVIKLHKSNVKVADYFTILPSKEILLDRLNKAIEIAKNSVRSGGREMG